MYISCLFRSEQSCKNVLSKSIKDDLIMGKKSKNFFIADFCELDHLETLTKKIVFRKIFGSSINFGSIFGENLNFVDEYLLKEILF